MKKSFRQFSPISGGFQYLLSFSDHTHFEHTNLNSLHGAVKNCAKTTDRVVLKWIIKHNIEQEENELTVIVRINNPINPLVFLQAALSKSPEDIDNLDFEGGAVSVSVDGAGQVAAEEIFSVVGNWIDSRPQPQYAVSIHEFFERNMKWFYIANYWLFPGLVAVILFLILSKQTSTQVAISYLFAAIIFHWYASGIATRVNNKLERWSRTASIFSVFSLTGGDSNQQARFAAKSRTSVIKMIVTQSLSFVLNVAAGVLTAILLKT